MKVNIDRLAEAKGFILYAREKTKLPGYAPWPKYFITGTGYFKEFNRKATAQKEFLKLTT